MCEFVYFSVEAGEGAATHEKPTFLNIVFLFSWCTASSDQGANLYQTMVPCWQMPGKNQEPLGPSVAVECGKVAEPSVPETVVEPEETQTAGLLRWLGY